MRIGTHWRKQSAVSMTLTEWSALASVLALWLDYADDEDECLTALYGDQEAKRIVARVRRALAAINAGIGLPSGKPVPSANGCESSGSGAAGPRSTRRSRAG